MKRAFGAVLAIALLAASVAAQTPAPAKGVAFPAISADDLRGWLTYLASDELQGRQVFTEGYGIAAQFIAERLREFGVKPLGEHGSYFQIVKLRSYKVTRHSSVTVDANGESRTFRDGDHVFFPAGAGGSQTLSFSGAQLVGTMSSGTEPQEIRDKLVLLLNAGRDPGPSAFSDFAVEKGARGVIEYAGTLPTPASQLPATTQRVDSPKTPQLVGDATFFSAVFAGRPVPFDGVKARLDRGDRVDSMPMSDVKITIHVENSYEPLTTQLSRNVVGLVEGTDPQLKDTYVLFGAHLDHVGYAVNSQGQHSDGSLVGTIRNPIDSDTIWNGADDDGTGTTADLAIAKAFATGPKPRRSIVFIWHAGEEAGLYGSLYNADFPIVPLERVQAELNIDMVGRNRDDDPRQANTLFVIGADRISTDLHNLIVDVNGSLQHPLKLDYEYNDPADPNSFYTRSDHYSYASKGIPIAFFFTGTHADYHANSDSVEKILFDKQARVTQLVYEIGFSIADSPAALRRDNRGPRAGRGFSGRLR